MNQLTAQDALDLIIDRAQDCRENGESDMRTIIGTARYLKQCIDNGKSREEIIAEWVEEE